MSPLQCFHPSRAVIHSGKLIFYLSVLLVITVAQKINRITQLFVSTFMLLGICVVRIAKPVIFIVVACVLHICKTMF
jgi:hypothetical protein